MKELFTFGHGTAAADRIIELLRGADVHTLVDVRTAPGSRYNPHVARDRLAEWLPENGIEYCWDKRLGGWRKARPDSPDIALRNRAFRGYAAHMRSPEFRAATEDLIASPERTAIMCSESVWWRCHRRMIADFLVLACDTPVWHLLHDGRLHEHILTDGARKRADGLLVYDGGQPDLWEH